MSNLVYWKGYKNRCSCMPWSILKQMDFSWY